MLSDTEAPFRLTTLGSLSIVGPDGVPTGLATRRRALALLALAGSGRDGVTRDRAMALLWPELNAASARNNLKQTVFAIRRELGVAAFDRSTSNVSLDRHVIAVDAQAFERAIDANALEESAQRYTGPFLDGYYIPHVTEFDRWVERVRARLAWSYTRALEILVVNARARGDAAASVQWGLRLAEHDPLSTAYALSLITALGDAGEPLKALDHARAYTKLIHEEFGAEPDQRIALAAERVRRSLLYPGASAQSPPALSAPAGSFPPVFVERDPARPPRRSGPLRLADTELQ